MSENRLGKSYEQIEAETGTVALPGLNGNGKKSEFVSTAESGFQIAKILESVPDRQFDNVFRFLVSVRRTTQGETVQELADGLNRLDRERRESERKPEKKGWFR